MSTNLPESARSRAATIVEGILADWGTVVRVADRSRLAANIVSPFSFSGEPPRITDEMVERAEAVLYPIGSTLVRAALEAALSPSHGDAA